MNPVTNAPTINDDTDSDAAAISSEAIDTFSHYKASSLPRCILNALSEPLPYSSHFSSSSSSSSSKLQLSSPQSPSQLLSLSASLPYSPFPQNSNDGGEEKEKGDKKENEEKGVCTDVQQIGGIGNRKIVTKETGRVVIEIMNSDEGEKSCLSSIGNRRENENNNLRGKVEDDDEGSVNNNKKSDPIRLKETKEEDNRCINDDLSITQTVAIKAMTTQSVAAVAAQKYAILSKHNPSHTSPACESALLSSVSPPSIPDECVSCLLELASSRALSSLQLEGAALAIRRHNRLLLSATDPLSSRRAGFFLGDGAGVGKGRQVAAVIRDSLFRGRSRHLWISVCRDLLLDAKVDYD